MNFLNGIAAIAREDMIDLNEADINLGTANVGTGTIERKLWSWCQSYIKDGNK